MRRLAVVLASLAAAFAAAPAGDEAQGMYATANFEHPVEAGVRTRPLSSPLVESRGTFKADELPLEAIAHHREAAARLVDKTGLDGGPAG